MSTQLDSCGGVWVCSAQTHVVLCLIQKHEAPGFGESYTEDLPTFSLSPQEYITNVRLELYLIYTPKHRLY